MKILLATNNKDKVFEIKKIFTIPEFATIEHIEYIRKNIENVNVQILSNAHHTFNLDEQKYIGELIFDFFKKYVCTSDYKDSH